MEYLITYCWALILIATVIGALVFVVSRPASSVTFSSSDPAKILMKGGAVSSGEAEIKLQNITGGDIQITGITEQGYTSCKIDGISTPPISITAGSQMTLECTAPADNQGTVTLQYTDYAGLQRSVGITASGTAAAGTGCTDSQTQNCPLQQGVCSGAEETCTGGAWPGCDAATYQSHNANYEVTEATCDDTFDNDCDGDTDCDDSDCSADPVCTASLTALWHFDEGSGASVSDSSGNALNGELRPDAATGPQWETTGCPSNSCLYFDGSNDKVYIYDSPLLSVNTTDNITYMAWVKPAAAPVTDCVGYCTIVGDLSGPCFEFHGERLNWYLGSEKYTPYLTWVVGQWYHVAVVVNGTTSVKWYKDGAEVATWSPNDGQTDRNPDWFGIYENPL